MSLAAALHYGTSAMPHDAPPQREIPKLVDLQGRAEMSPYPRLVPLSGPRRQSTTITIPLPAITTLLAVPAVICAFADSTLKTAFTAQLVRWYSSSLLLFCAAGVLIIGARLQREHRRHMLAAAALAVLSFFTAAPAETWELGTVRDALRHYPFLAIVGMASLGCCILAMEARRQERVSYAPSLLVYLGGALAALLCRQHAPEHALAGLLMSLGNLGCMLGPVLALRAMALHLSPADRPMALRFVLATPSDDSR